MRGRTLFFAALIWVLGAGLASAQRAAEKILPLDAQIAADGRAIELFWFDAEPKRVGSVTVKRRLYGQTGGETWQTLASGLGPVMRYRDETIRPGVAYEYQVLRIGRDIVDVGYWLAGTEIAAQDARGTAHLVIDTTLHEDLSVHLRRFTQDLVGDGWSVRRYLAPRGRPGHSLAQTQQADQIKLALRNAYLADPFGAHTVILIGHIPIVYSGMAAPDGHAPVPHPTDLFYAEMDGQWQASSDGVMLHNELPSDFIEMQIGRIDFSNLSEGNRDRELQFLRAYFDKNHHWRMGLLGDLREAYGGSNSLRVDRAGLRNIVGPGAVYEGRHHDVGEEKPWLWGVDFGDYNGRNYLEKYANKAVFTVNFGSSKQRFDGPLNTMTALLAQPWYTLAVGWGGRPAWWPHHMALGGAIGEVHLRTLNNGRAGQPYRDSMDYFPTGDYLWRNPVWVNLMGDPTLRAFPLPPPRDVAARQEDGQVTLSWQASPDPDTQGYRIYRAASDSSIFSPIGTTEGAMEVSFTDNAPVENAIYMIRAHGLKTVHAGSFHTYSQGVFGMSPVERSENALGELQISVKAGQATALPAFLHDTTQGHITSIIEGPSVGTVERKDGVWHYTAPADFHGRVSLRVSMWQGQQTEEHILTISVAGS